MKNIMFKFGGVVAGLAFVVAFLNANSACLFISHQPKLPQGAKKLRKI